ncbi:MAG: hypothetical protein ABF504_10110 [Komagataeibacter saccharivorans]|uniref:hypothetical protein n=1 Tax=Komagataeibacter saccharivorans TaxID=265959 RepID=UPI0039E8E305
MSNVTINGRPVSILEYRGQRVVTLAMVDALHQRIEDTAGRNFRAPRQPDLPRNPLATMEPTELNARIGACRQASRQWGKSAGAWAWMKAGLPRPPRELLSAAENAVLDAVDGSKPAPPPVQRRIMIIEDVQGGLR